MALMMLAQQSALTSGVGRAQLSSRQTRSQAFRASQYQVTGRRTSTIVAVRQYRDRDSASSTAKRAGNEADQQSTELLDKANAYVDDLKAKWDETDEKPAVIAITSAAFVGVWALSGLVDRIDKLPIVGGLLELVGLVVTSWFVYRYLIFGPDREELKQNLDKFLSKVTGN
ncbi:hypothetical protein ABBQ32_010808 [Trebouxia sp. C0010 RCD-2024]